MGRLSSISGRLGCFRDMLEESAGHSRPFFWYKDIFFWDVMGRHGTLGTCVWDIVEMLSRHWGGKCDICVELGGMNE